MGRRKHISKDAKLASTLLMLGDVPYEHAKQMTAAQMISLYQWDGNIYHSDDPDGHDQFWNLAPMLIFKHREKTRSDITVIAKGRRIRRKHREREIARAAEDAAFERWAKSKRRNARRIQSRGFDKTLRKKMDGTVVKR